MLSKLKFLVFASFIAAVSANPVVRNLILHEQRESIPKGFVKIGSASEEQVLNLRLSLVSSDAPGLENALYAVSTPDSARYGQHLTKEEVEEFVKPSQDSATKVNAFLASHNIQAKSISPAGDWLAFSVPVSKANEMFNADFSVFKHQESGTQYVRTLSYSIPTDLQGHLNLVHPTVTFERPFSAPVVSSPRMSIPKAQNVTTLASVPSSCDSEITPACLQALYNIPDTLATQSSNGLGVAGFLEQFVSEDDLELFLESLRPDLPSSTTFTLQTLDDGSNPQGAGQAGLEANLDIQYTIGVASGVPTTFISVGDTNSDGQLGGFLDIINFLLSEDNPPFVLTTSYGFNEEDISPSLASVLCNAYAQLGTRGTSILFASGDGGVSGSQSQDCTEFVPTFPSSCPFLTSVGATAGITETAADLSAGGFSNVFGIPSYQASAVSSYLSELGSTNDGLFNTTGRAYPDVSAQGENVLIAINDGGELVQGTSCSSPIFASVIALLNDRLIAAGKSPLGFLNPFLYSSVGANALNDVTSGSNPGCGTNGFPATTGWDPVTGLGTPDFAKLLTAIGL
ncbi:hypothetical protein EW145_g7124 [Phellinidium pouzarii]|uniref:tripeptidyl-peptidase II n=1 Tax=Phellinidium pouzarii TaxID=167371 RepID=A0A4S4KNN9_9AGAM|nr:hypothetical protein EW145_g7124 [Phellinidium pouzarii]